MKKVVVVLLALVAFVLLLGADRRADVADANSPGSTIKPLLICPDVDGSGNMRTGDIIKEVLAYGEPNYAFLYDLDANGITRTADISAAVRNYGRDCPLVDTQVAQATRAIIDPTYRNVLCGGTETTPALCGGDRGLLDCDEQEFEARGYLRSSIDGPGQGVHYVNRSYWDGVFNPLRPEGLVCDDAGGKLVAQLYYVDGDQVGWLSGGQTSQPCPNDHPWHAEMGHCMQQHGVQVDAFCSPVQGETACSWGGTGDGWHWHVDLCTVHVGEASAAAIPGMSEQTCHTYGGGNCTWDPDPSPNCFWDADTGWMGHLWNHAGNPNLVDEDGDAIPDNGRFADCTPDGSTWKPFTCPA